MHKILGAVFWKKNLKNIKIDSHLPFMKHKSDIKEQIFYKVLYMASERPYELVCEVSAQTL